jgi:short-subunit dehydrogenase
VVLSARKAEELEHASTQLRGQGIDAHWFAADCQKEAEHNQHDHQWNHGKASGDS